MLITSLGKTPNDGHDVTDGNVVRASERKRVNG
jgi:hypothetical protein